MHDWTCLLLNLTDEFVLIFVFHHTVWYYYFHISYYHQHFYTVQILTKIKIKIEISLVRHARFGSHRGGIISYYSCYINLRNKLNILKGLK
jgi:hypothetical protein